MRHFSKNNEKRNSNFTAVQWSTAPNLSEQKALEN